MKYAIFALLFLGACAQVDAYQAAVAYAGAKAADDALETAEWFVCKGASIGAVRRAHGQDAATYRAFCDGASDADLISAE